ncbi:ABC transporter substrate-binding protein [Pseudonocardia sp. NPDC049154]|uniref:ABC transporter substrate-binding protein n=1 Tax=Pseudonocardia sp. NPDC049154 TaxID=3155501 RepID=UPI00340AFA2D
MKRLLTAALGGLLALGLAACGTSAAPESTGAEPVSVVLGWYPTAESGGFYAAEEQGLFAQQGLDVDIQPGGPQVSQTQVVASGRADFGLSDATTIANARAAGIPIVAVAALFQENPVGVMVHADSGAADWKDLAGRTWYVQTGQLGQEWVKRSQGIDFTTAAYNGSITTFLHDDAAVQQGWPTNEAYQAQKEGVRTRFLSYASAGYDPYNDVVFTTQDFLREHPDRVRAFLDATMHGWSAYMSDTALAEKVNTTLQQENPQLDPAANWFAWDAQRKFLTAGGTLGAMTAERWSTLVDQMTQLGALQPGLDPASLFDTSALPTVPAPTTLPPAP